MSKINFPRVYSTFDPPPAVGTDCTIQAQGEPEDRTDQTQRDDADINRIVSRYIQTGILPPAKAAAQFMDVSKFGDLKESRDFIRDAESTFMLLDAKIREHFDNDAAKLLDAFNDQSRREELTNLGLLNPLPEAAPAPLNSPEGGLAASSQPASKKAKENT